ncbi:hypothetical protein T261_0393 [Streptomyces lydicus]|nr:hypothetical protein T261_0393 [Streptomyces lydicus]
MGWCDLFHRLTNARAVIVVIAGARFRCIGRGIGGVVMVVWS